MAPMTRSQAMAPQVSQEGEWTETERFEERELSERSISSQDGENGIFNERQDVESESNSYYEFNKMPLRGPEDEDDVLHPLRATVDRVGTEVEQFAQILDRFNPQRITDKTERQEMMFELIDKFHNIALKTVDSLREKHASERRKLEGRKWRKKMRGLKITQENDLQVQNLDGLDSTELGSRTTIKDLDHWEQEAQTWDLLKRLATVRFGTKLQDHKLNHFYVSKKELYDHFLATEELALERKTVLQWLKDTAEESGEDIDVLVEDLQQNAERGDIIAHGWLHTKAAIKDHKRRTASSHALDPKAQNVEKVLLNTARTEPLTTQLDPDAPNRQGRRLATQDQYFERAIWLGCYELLRRGNSLSKISEWCMERTEIWRAVSMSGVSFEDSEEDRNFASPDVMIRWRKICLSIAHTIGNSEYENAVYGILGGDISSVEPVCKTWDDFMFVHYNSILRTQFDNYLKNIQLQITETRPYVPPKNTDSAQNFSEPQDSRQRLIAILMTNPKILKESKKPMKILQGVLIADQFSHFIFQQGLALSQIANAKEVSRVIPPSKHQLDDVDLTKYVTFDDHDSLRVLTHVLIIFMGLGLDLGDVYRETEIQNVMVAYITFLKLAAKEELIPLYCSQLSGIRKYSILSRNLIDIIDEDQQIVQLKLMRKLGLDVQEFVSLQARYLLDDFPDSSRDFLALGNLKLFSDNYESSSLFRTLKKDFISEKYSAGRIDLLLIRSLKWYLLVDGLWVESFRLGTLLYLRFFKHMNLHAAKMLSINVPSKVLMERKTRAILGESLNLFNSNIDFINEESSTGALKAYLLNEARNFRELEILIECLDSIDTANCLVEIKKQGLSNQKPPILLREWRSDYQTACEESHSCARLLMKGWLLKSPNESIKNDLEHIRQAYLPEILIAYITTLQVAGLYLNQDFLLEAMEVSSILADEDSDVLETFIRTGRLHEMVDNLARASKTLLTVSSSKQKSVSRSIRLKKQGRTLKLWNVKP
ncbi:putative nuclear pore complex protein [Erysiphe necator]|uniref:Nuclear pore complex protein n=1 Tax=Uncinula necator TaxID=52586 RepID=A0A0B1PEU6_UNCNE|nr:putative nuclear pore complex protein [Erysiphe necator]